MPGATSVSSALGRRRWLILGVIGLAQLMVVLDLTVMNIALPSAQRALHFTTVDRQWVVTAYALAFGSLLTTTFTEPEERGKAFGVFGATAVAGGAVGLLLGGALTEYLSWRWTLYVNLIFAGVAFTGGALLLQRQPSPARPRLDIPGVLLVSSAVFCLVYGFSNAATHGWRTPSSYRFLAAGAALLAAFALWQGRAAHPLLPPRVVLDRNPGRRLPVDADRRSWPVRHLLFPDLLPAANARVLPAGHRHRVPADQRRLRCRL